MSALVSIVDGIPTTTTLAIAQGAEVDHASVIKLVRTYQEDLAEFGLVRFEIRAREPGKHGGGDTEYATLNEQQTTLLFTYMRNTAIVRDFKKRLVKEFYELAHAAHQPRELTRRELLISNLELLDAKEKLEAELAAAQPAIQMQQEISQGNEEYTTRDLCKILFNGSVKERELKAWCIRNKWRNQDGMPSAWALQRGLMRVRIDVTPIGTCRVAVFTGKGFVTLRHMYRENDVFVFDVPRAQLMAPGGAA